MRRLSSVLGMLPGFVLSHSLSLSSPSAQLYLLGPAHVQDLTADLIPASSAADSPPERSRVQFARIHRPHIPLNATTTWPM